MADVEPNGFEKTLVGIAIGVSKIEDGLFKIVYGTGDNAGIQFPGRKSKTNGLLPIMREINAIDLCNYINYTLNNLKISSTDGQTPNGLQAKVDSIKDFAKKVCDQLDAILLQPDLITDQSVLGNTIKALQDVSKLIDTDIVTLLPQAANVKNKINELIGNITQYPALIATYTDYNNIPNEDIQKVFKAIQDVRAVAGIIASISSVGDITRTLIPNQIQELQKIVSPAYLLPIIRKGTTLARAVNQQAQKLIGYVNILKIVVKVLSVVLKVLQIIIKFFSTLPLPSMFITHGITDVLISARQKAEELIKEYLKRLEQIGVIIDIIYNFSIVMGTIIDQVTRELEILQLTLESCDATNTSPAIEEIKNTKASLKSSKAGLDQFNANYKASTNDRLKAKFNGYVLKIEEEEIVDNDIKYKRRRAVAFDNNGVLVAATELTFATDITILFDELKLILVNSGFVSDLGYPVPDVSGFQRILDIPTSDTELYNSVGLRGQSQLDAQNKAVQAEITSFLSGLKGGDALRNKTRLGVDNDTQALKAAIKGGYYNPTSGSSSLNTGGLDRSGNYPVNTGGRDFTNILSDEERTRLQKIVKEYPTSSSAFKVAKEKLELDRKARTGQ